MTLKIDSAASSRSQWKVTYFMYFDWSALEVRLFSFLFTRCL